MNINYADITNASKKDREMLASLAIGRILRLGFRPTQEGDVKEYDRCRAIVIEAIGEKSTADLNL